MNFKRDLKSFNLILVLLVCALSIYGLIAVGSAMHINVNPSSVIYGRQKLFFFIGLILLFVTAFIDYNFICKFYIPLYILNILLLLYVIMFGDTSVADVARWIQIGPIKIQPSEFSKIFFIIFIAKYIDKKNNTINNIIVLGCVIIFTLVPVVLIKIQPSLSASLVTFAIAVSVLFVAKLSYKYYLAVILASIPIGIVFAMDLLKETPTIIVRFLDDYQIDRSLAFLAKNPTDNLYRQTFFSTQAIGSGMFSGKGLYNGNLIKLGYIESAQNDFIFATIGEEFGFIGCMAALVIMLFIIIECLLIAQKSNNNVSKYIIAGIVGMFAFQTFFNVAVATGLSINTGMPFPFMSAGGSSMFVNMIAIGIVLNIGMEKPKSIFEG